MGSSARKADNVMCESKRMVEIIFVLCLEPSIVCLYLLSIFLAVRHYHQSLFFSTEVISSINLGCPRLTFRTGPVIYLWLNKVSGNEISWDKIGGKYDRIIKAPHCVWLNVGQLHGPRLSIKTVFQGIEIPMLKTIWSQDRLVFNIGISPQVSNSAVIDYVEWTDLWHPWRDISTGSDNSLSRNDANLYLYFSQNDSAPKG